MIFFHKITLYSKLLLLQQYGFMIYIIEVCWFSNLNKCELFM